MSWGNPQTTGERLLSGLLKPVSAAFLAGSYCRIMSYNLGLLKQKHFAQPVISVGNLTVGGTGKTPIVVDICQRLSDSGHKVGILSRGYKRLSRASSVIVSAGQGPITSCADAGDEPYMMALSCPQAVVIVGASRTTAAAMAIQDHGCDILILDDGFQHFPMSRDTDIVLIDYNDDLLKDSLLPSGRLREPVSALVRAHWIVITKVPDVFDEEKLEQVRSLLSSASPSATITACRFEPSALTPFGCQEVALSPSALAQTKVLAFCGIARPENFQAELESLGAEVVGQRSFGDHHWYTAQDIASLKSLAQSTQAEMLVTTEKDAVRLSSQLVGDLPIATLKLKCAWLGPIPPGASLDKSNRMGM